jgi:hypothetical protein
MPASRQKGHSQPVDWVDLVERIQAGDQQAVSRLEDIFQVGIHFFLCRTLGQHKLEYRQREVLSLVIRNIREPGFDNPNRLGSHVLMVLRQYIGFQMTACPHLVAEDQSRANADGRAVGELLANITAIDKEAFKRYREDKKLPRPLSAARAGKE